MTLNRLLLKYHKHDCNKDLAESQPDKTSCSLNLRHANTRLFWTSSYSRCYLTAENCAPLCFSSDTLSTRYVVVRPSLVGLHFEFPSKRLCAFSQRKTNSHYWQSKASHLCRNKDSAGLLTKTNMPTKRCHSVAITSHHLAASTQLPTWLYMYNCIYRLKTRELFRHGRKTGCRHRIL